MKPKIWISLISTIINEHYGISKWKYDFFVAKKNRVDSIVLAFLFLLVLPASIAYPYYMFMETMFKAYNSIGLSGLFVSNALTMAGLMGFILGIFSLVSEFFFSKNMKVFVPLPLKPSQVLSAKLMVVIMDQMIVSIIALLPPLIYFGIMSKAGIEFWFYMIVIFLLSQTFSLTLSLIVILPVSRIIKFKKHQDFLVMILFVVFLAAVLIFQYFSMTFFPSNDPVEMTKMLTNQNTFINRIAAAFPPAVFGTKALINPGIEGFLNFIYYVVINIGGLVLAMFIGDRFYYSTYTEMQENYSEKKKLSSDEIAVLFSKKSSPKKALMNREWRYFLRIPAFSTNGIANVIVLPILLFIFFSATPAITQSANGGKELQMMLDAMKQFRGYMPLWFALMGTMFGAMNALAPSLFSREGKLFYELKMLPVTPVQILKTKLKMISFMSFLGAVLTELVLALYMNAWIELIPAIIATIIFIIFLNFLQMLIDIHRPVLNWENPMKAMKSNNNVALTIPITFGFSFGLGYLGYLLMNKVSVYVILVPLCIVLAAVSYYLWKTIIKQTEVLLRKEL